MFVITVLSIGIAAVFCLVFVKIGYKTGAIDQIPIETTEKDQNTEVQYNTAYGNMIDTLKQMTINKLLSSSGKERMAREMAGFSLIKYSPIVGIGLGSFRTFSLFTNILINTGIIGILSFLYMIFVVLKQLINYRKVDEVGSMMFIISIISTTIALFIGVPDFVFMYYWIIIVLGYKFSDEGKM